MNRLAAETSPYLLQHADNPVDWYPWGEEAFARARAEDKPIGRHPAAFPSTSTATKTASSQIGAPLLLSVTQFLRAFSLGRRPDWPTGRLMRAQSRAVAPFNPSVCNCPKQVARVGSAGGAQLRAAVADWFRFPPAATSNRACGSPAVLAEARRLGAVTGEHESVGLVARLRQ